MKRELSDRDLESVSGGIVGTLAQLATDVVVEVAVNWERIKAEAVEAAKKLYR